MDNMNNMNNITLNSNDEESTESEREYVFHRVEIHFNSNEKYEQTDYDTQSFCDYEYLVINPEGLPVKTTRAMYNKII